MPAARQRLSEITQVAARHGFGYLFTLRLLAAASGSLASGIGYALWYTVVRDLTATRAAVIQLCVPVLAASGGVLFLSEEITFRLLASATLILGGVWLSVSGRVDKRQ